MMDSRSEEKRSDAVVEGWMVLRMTEAGVHPNPFDPRPDAMEEEERRVRCDLDSWRRSRDAVAARLARPRPSTRGYDWDAWSHPGPWDPASRGSSRAEGLRSPFIRTRLPFVPAPVVGKVHCFGCRKGYCRKGLENLPEPCRKGSRFGLSERNSFQTDDGTFPTSRQYWLLRSFQDESGS